MKPMAENLMMDSNLSTPCLLSAEPGLARVTSRSGIEMKSGRQARSHAFYAKDMAIRSIGCTQTLHELETKPPAGTKESIPHRTIRESSD